MNLDAAVTRVSEESVPVAVSLRLSLAQKRFTCWGGTFWPPIGTVPLCPIYPKVYQAPCTGKEFGISKSKENISLLTLCLCSDTLT